MDFPQRLIFFLLSGLLLCNPVHADSRLLATSGVTQLEGSAGGGLVPWAVMSGYADEGETAAGAFYTAVDVQDFRLRVTGVTLSYDNRVEVSAAQQAFEIKGVADDIRQEIFSAKVRVAGDLIYGSMPQIATGVQFKNLLDGYVSLTRLHLGAVGGYNLLWNLSLRATKANQMGLLGYGGDESAGYQLMPEASVAVLLDNGLAVGGEYRQKPDNLSAFSEDDFMDIFIAWFPNKQVNLTLAWADLGSIAGSEKQSGLYASLSAFFY